MAQLKNARPPLFAGMVLLLIAYSLLFPGLTEPMLSVTGSVEKVKLVNEGKEFIQSIDHTPAFVDNLIDMAFDRLQVSGTVNAFDKTQSIIGTAHDLYQQGHSLVAMLIVFFSVIVPLIKALLLLSLLLPFSLDKKLALLWVSNGISKWSMTDVFVIAIFVAFLAGNGLQGDRNLVDFEASIGNGFWFFLGYCVVSIAGTQLVGFAAKKTLAASASASTSPDSTPRTY